MSILFFDSQCVLCNKSALWLLKRNINSDVQFASLNGKNAKKLLSSEALTVNSIVFLKDNKEYFKSDAVFLIVGDVPCFKWLKILKIVPRFLRDKIYDWVAQNRFKWFGKQEGCVLPDTQFRKRYIDE